MKNKRNVMISLCVAILFMAVGYAAFSTALNISGTANIASEWKVVFTNIVKESSKGEIQINEAPKVEGTSATFNVGLQSPGDYIRYTITVENQGTLDAIIENITFVDGDSSANDPIVFQIEGIATGDTLEKKDTKTFNVLIKYNENITTQPSDSEKTKELTVNIKFIQKLGNQTVDPDLPIEVKSLSTAILKNGDGTPKYVSDENIAFTLASKYDLHKHDENGYFLDAEGNVLCEETTASDATHNSACGEQVDGIKLIPISTPNETVPVTEGTTGKLYATSDTTNTEDQKTVYYFRGAVDNNYVKFGKDASGNDLYWRIVRINEDGSIRLIYHGTSITGSSDNIGSSYYNATIDGDGAPTALYNHITLGYMYGNDNLSYENVRANINDSTVKTAIDNWYVSTNLDDLREDYLADAGFCNDRKHYTGDGYSNNSNYESLRRLKNNGNPQYKCNNASTDLFTTGSSPKGNKALTNPIGLITADEAVYAGMSYGVSSDDSYIRSNETPYWTMTPYNQTRIWIVGTVEDITKIGTTAHTDLNKFAIRPVINLKADVNVEISGNGTTTTPYVVQ